MPEFTTYDHASGDYKAVPGTEDFVSVVYESTGGYDWSAFGAYYSPSRRRYFWLHDGGCSCNSFGDSVKSVEEFENGDRAALLRAVEEAITVPQRDAYGDYYTAADRARAIAAVRDFREVPA
jgi:hypothetical protein